MKTNYENFTMLFKNINSNRELKLIDKLLLATILSFQLNNQPFTASDEYLANELGVSTRTITSSIARMFKNNIINKTGKQRSKRTITVVDTNRWTIYIKPVEIVQPEAPNEVIKPLIEVISTEDEFLKPDGNSDDTSIKLTSRLLTDVDYGNSIIAMLSPSDKQKFDHFGKTQDIENMVDLLEIYERKGSLMYNKH